MAGGKHSGRWQGYSMVERLSKEPSEGTADSIAKMGPWPRLRPLVLSDMARPRHLFAVTNEQELGRVHSN